MDTRPKALRAVVAACIRVFFFAVIVATVAADPRGGSRSCMHKTRKGGDFSTRRTHTAVLTLRTPRMETKSRIGAPAHAMLMRSRRSSSSSFFTNRPFTRMRLSAKFLRTSYLTCFLVHTRRWRFSKKRCTRCRLASGE